MTSGHVEKNSLIKKIRSILKFMTWKPGLKAFTIHILPNISRSKGNQAMKLGQVTECKKRKICLHKSCRKWGGETSSRPLCFLKKVWDKFLHHILRMIFEEKCFSCYILLPGQISLTDCLYIPRYWLICVFQLFVTQIVTSSILK